MMKIGPCKITKKNYDNPYVLVFPIKLDVSPIYNVTYMYEFHEGLIYEYDDYVTNWRDYIIEREK